MSAGTIDNSGTNSGGGQTNCPNCAGNVTSQDKFCRFCGKDIESVSEPVKEIIASATKAEPATEELREKINKFNEQRAVTIANNRKLHRNPVFLIGSTIAVVAAAGILTFSSISATEAHNKEVAAKNNWKELVPKCDDELSAKYESYTFTGDHQIKFSGDDVGGNKWLGCVGKLITVDAPNDKTGDWAFTNELGWHIWDGQNGVWTGGGLGAVEIEYGNLKVWTNRTESNHYDVTISMIQ